MSDHATAQASGRRLLNATAIMASGTMISKILGFVKASLLVIVLGASTPQADAYSVATLVPNTLYMIFAGGALNTVLVPQIVRHINHDDDHGEAFVNRIMTAFLIVLAAVTVLALVLTPQIISLWTDAGWRTPALAPHWDKLVLLAFVTMPQLFFFGAFFLVGQVLNARDRFGPMMWAPILNNIVGIGVLGGYAAIWGTTVDPKVPFTTTQVMVLGIGSTLGIVVQTLALIPFMRKAGFRYRPRFDLRGAGLGATFHLAKWMLGYVLLTTLVQIVVQNLASSANVASGGAGAGNTVYNTANLVWLLPHSLLTVSLATAMLPSASRLAAQQDYPGVAAETMRTMRLATTFLLPSSVGFLVLGFPFAQLAFGHGAAATQWPLIAWTLLAFAVGLVPFTVQYVYLRGYYALEDTRTPFFIQIAISGGNVLLALGLIAVDANPATVAPRLALAYTGSYLLGAVLTHFQLKRRLPGLAGDELMRHLAQLVLAIAPGAVIAALIGWLVPTEGTLATFGTFLAGFVALVLPFFFFAKRLGIHEATQLIAVLRRRGAPEEPEAADQPEPDPEPPAVTEPDADDEEPPALVYPDPLDGHELATDVPDGVVEVSAVEAGQVLDDRYRLDEILARRGGTLTWRGFDHLLGRPVLIHVMAPSDPRTLQILDEARTAAPAVDSRFLRVWDAVLVEGQAHGSFIVCEYAPGLSLELVLRQGPLTPVEAGWLVREVADALAGMHTVGLHHRRLNPDTIIVTASGNVKIVGFLVEAALHASAPGSDGERDDLLGLADLLYCALLGRWPHGAAYGLAAAPTDQQGRALLPRQVDPAVPASLNDIIDRIVNEFPVCRQAPITSAAELATALATAIHGVDASHDLERRLRFPVTPIRFGSIPRPSVGESPAAGAPAAATWVPRPRAHVTEPVSPEDDETARYLVDFADDASDDDESTEPFTPIPPPPAPPASEEADEEHRLPIRVPRVIRQRWTAALGILFVSVLVASLVGVFIGQYERSRQPAPPAQPSVYAVASVRDFDPKADGGDARENPDQANYAVDQNPSTAWTTERYGRTATFNDRKPGAGLVLDLGSPVDVGQVRLSLGSGTTGGEIRVPNDLSVTSPPMKTVKEWKVVAPIPLSSGDVTVKLEQPVKSRFVLVYLTSMPDRGSYFQGAISAVEVAGA